MGSVGFEPTTRVKTKDLAFLVAFLDFAALFAARLPAGEITTRNASAFWNTVRQMHFGSPVSAENVKGRRIVG
jgi:hypothetical protein